MPRHDRLFELLGKMPDEHLMTLWTQALREKEDKHDFAAALRQVKVDMLSKELRSVAGHSVANLYRNIKGEGAHSLEWKRILIDVADQLKPGVKWTRFKMDDEYTEQQIEARILQYTDELAQKTWQKLSDAEKQAMVDGLNQRMHGASKSVEVMAQQRAIQTVTVSTMGSAVASGLLMGGGLSMLISGTSAALLGGLFGGLFAQIGLWLVLQFAGWWLGLKLIIGGSLGMIGALATVPPVAAISIGSAAMGPGYKKSIPAVVLILASNRVDELFAELDK